MPECYIRGSTIKYLRIPDEVIDMVKEETVIKNKGRNDMKGGRGQNQRNRPAARGNICMLMSRVALVHVLSLFVGNFGGGRGNKPGGQGGRNPPFQKQKPKQ